MTRVMAALLLCALSGAATAADCVANLSWTAPTQNTDNSALAKCSSQTSTGDCLRGFKVYHGNSASALTTTLDINDRNATSLVVTLPNCSSHTHYYAVSAYKGTGHESALSTVGNKAFSIVVDPKPPGNFTVSDPVAYRMRQSVDGFEFVALGTVPLGTDCDDRDVAGYHLIQRANVTLANQFDTLPLTVFAKCSAG